MEDPPEPISWEGFGVALSALRERSGMTMVQLSAASNALDGTAVSVSYISRLSHDLERPTPVVIRRLAAALRVRPEYFLAYRLAQARAELDETGPGGVEHAARRLRDYRSEHDRW